MDLWGLVKERKFRQPSSRQERRLIGNVISHRPSPSSRPLPGGTVWGCVKARAHRWKDWLPFCAEDRGLLANSAAQCGMWLGYARGLTWTGEGVISHPGEGHSVPFLSLSFSLSFFCTLTLSLLHFFLVCQLRLSFCSINILTKYWKKKKNSTTCKLLVKMFW